MAQTRSHFRHISVTAVMQTQLDQRSRNNPRPQKDSSAVSVVILQKSMDTHLEQQILHGWNDRHSASDDKRPLMIQAVQYVDVRPVASERAE